MADAVSVADRRRIEALRAKVRAMDYAPLTDEQLEEIAKLSLDAIANDAIEGIYLTADEIAFFEMLDEERVPHDLRRRLAYDFLFGEQATAAADWQPTPRRRQRRKHQPGRVRIGALTPGLAFFRRR